MSKDIAKSDEGGELSDNELDGVVGGSKFGDAFKKLGHELSDTAHNVEQTIANGYNQHIGDLGYITTGNGQIGYSKTGK